MRCPVFPDNLSDLPEYRDWDDEVLDTGETVRHRRVPELEFVELTSDMPIIFSDSEGSWFIDYHLKGGPYKRRAMF